MLLACRCEIVSEMEIPRAEHLQVASQIFKSSASGGLGGLLGGRSRAGQVPELPGARSGGPANYGLLRSSSP